MVQIIIYSQKKTARLEYIFSVIIPSIGFKSYQLTSDQTVFKNSTLPKLNYSTARITVEEVWIKPVNLLFENLVKEQFITCFTFNSTKAFFNTAEGDLPFDFFAASFYLLSRYEEYLPHKLDEYGRYAHQNSLAYKENFLDLPLVNIWLQHLNDLLRKAFPSLRLTPSTFQFLPTYDVDIAYSYLYKGWFRNAGGFLRSMWNSEWKGVQERLEVLFGKQQDPFDSYQWLDNLHQEFNLKPIYFFLAAKQNKAYDKNILPVQKALRQLIWQHKSKYEIGIHPSWQSEDEPKLLQQEIKTLEKITGEKVLKSRQHYIRMTLPETYRRLIDAGITEDYSMGYGSINGFRASYCLPYKWFDLPKEEATNLTIFPFCYMEANSYYEQHYTSQQALLELEHYYNVTHQVNGTLITIFHNHFLGTDRMFTGWREMYRSWIERIKRN